MKEHSYVDDAEFYYKERVPHEMVWEFNSTFAPNTISKAVGYPDEALRGLKLKLIREEMQELDDAEEVDDLVETIDALADIIYVIYGYAQSLGIDLDHFVSEVHASNMTKLGADGNPIYDEFGKVQKGPNYVEPDIAGVLKKYYEHEMSNDT